MNDNAQQALLEQLSVLAGPLRAVAQSEYLLRNLARSVGWDLDQITGLRIGDLQARLNQFVSSFETLGAFLESPPETLSELSKALDAVDQSFRSVREISTILAEGAQPSEFKEFGRDLISALTIAHLQGTAPLLYDLAVLFTLIEPGNNQSLSAPVFDSAGKLVRVPHTRPKLRLGRVVDLIKSPGEVLGAEYLGPNGLQNSTDALHTADKLFPRLGAVLASLGAKVAYGFKPGYGIDLGDPENLAGGMLTFWLELENANSQAGATLSLSPADQGNLGLVVSPFGTSEFIQPFESWALSASLTAGVDAFALGPDGFRLLLGEGTGGDRVSARLELSRLAEGEIGVTRIGSTTGTRLEAKQVRVLAEANLEPAEQEYGLLAEVAEAVLVVVPSDGDGFLREILPADGLRINFDLVLGWSNRLGLHFRGSAGLQAEIPVNLSVGPVFIQSVHLAIRAGSDGIQNELAATAALGLGPVNVVIEQIGLAANLTFPESGGNLGEANLSVGFKPPAGAGLAIDASVVVGGGFLSFDPHKQEYSGILHLLISDIISVDAIGLLSTRLPDGRPGFSLLAIIFAQGFAPIQLGFGFTLTGIGGLFAINRTFDEALLRAGLNSHTLDSVMFPRDPIRNAPLILSNLNRVFPPSRGNHLFGPMLQIAWGSPPLITADLALVFEIGARRRLLILAQIVAILPRRENDLLRLQMDAVGVLDFDQGSASLDAALHDSRLLDRFTLTGEMAMRLNWQGTPNFALAVGGLHPAFNPPPAFPKLKRIAINLSSGDNPRFRCEAYFALTSNTIQFGARAELFASAAGFSIQGEVGFDVLIQMDPFSFLAEFHAQLQLKRGSRSLFKVRLEGSLAGPRPLHIKGKATFEILWWDVSIRIDKRLVEGVKPPPPEPVAVLPRLKEALANPANWVAQLPAQKREVVRLRPRAAAAGEVLLHPSGSLRVKQNVVPLDVEITRFGQGAPSGARRFTITGVTVGGSEESKEAVREFFAPAQFFEMSDGEKLSRPSFELLTAGVEIATDEVGLTKETGDMLEVRAIEYETKMKGEDLEQPEEGGGEAGKKLYTLSAAQLEKQSRFGAAARSEDRRAGNARYRTGVVKHRVAKEGWSVVATDDLRVEAAPGVEEGEEMSYRQAEEALRRLKQEQPARAASLKILRLSEIS
ncbi:MAG TPA: DUF6603 domain-containing protein [Blastocatellia bacterium]|nr:DUF6603 domain-containing protein [Blastocatellia bacterium]